MTDHNDHPPTSTGRSRTFRRRVALGMVMALGLTVGHTLGLAAASNETHETSWQGLTQTGGSPPLCFQTKAKISNAGGGIPRANGWVRTRAWYTGVGGSYCSSSGSGGNASQRAMAVRAELNKTGLGACLATAGDGFGPAGYVTNASATSEMTIQHTAYAGTCGAGNYFVTGKGARLYGGTWTPSQASTNTYYYTYA